MLEYYLNLKRIIQDQTMYSTKSTQKGFLEKIWYYHTIYHPIDSEHIRNHFLSCPPVLQKLSHKNQRQLANIIVALCVEHERAAFKQGICIGLRLAREIDAIEAEMNKEKTE